MSKKRKSGYEVIPDGNGDFHFEKDGQSASDVCPDCAHDNHHGSGVKNDRHVLIAAGCK